MEGRLGDAALSEPVVALARQQAVRQKPAEGVKTARLLVVVPVVLLEDVPDVLRVRQQHHVAVGQSKVNDRTVIAYEIDQQTGRIPAHPGHLAQPALRLRARRKPQSHAVL